MSRCSYPSRRLSSRSDAVENCRTCTKYHVRNGIGISMYGMATQAIANAPMAIDDCWSVSKRHTGRSVSIWPIEIAMARHQTVHAHVSKPLSLSLSLKKKEKGWGRARYRLRDDSGWMMRRAVAPIRVVSSYKDAGELVEVTDLDLQRICSIFDRADSR